MQARRVMGGQGRNELRILSDVALRAVRLLLVLMVLTASPLGAQGPKPAPAGNRPAAVGQGGALAEGGGNDAGQEKSKSQSYVVGHMFIWEWLTVGLFAVLVVFAVGRSSRRN